MGIIVSMLEIPCRQPFRERELRIREGRRGYWSLHLLARKKGEKQYAKAGNFAWNGYRAWQSLNFSVPFAFWQCLFLCIV